MSINQIAEGFFNSIFERKESLYEERIKICRNCPLIRIDKLFGEVCNPRLYINRNGDVSKHPQKGYVKGCGCILTSKTRVDSAHCIINKW